MCQRGTTPVYIPTKFLRMQNVSAMKCVNNREHNVIITVIIFINLSRNKF